MILRFRNLNIHSLNVSFIFRGKLGASLHRSSRPQGIGGKPPYLKVLFIFRSLLVSSVMLKFTSTVQLFLCYEYGISLLVFLSHCLILSSVNAYYHLIFCFILCFLGVTVPALFRDVWIWWTYCIYAFRGVWFLSIMVFISILCPNMLHSLSFLFLPSLVIFNFFLFWFHRRVEVSSKTKHIKKVYILHLERDALLRTNWKVTVFSWKWLPWLFV